MTRTTLAQTKALVAAVAEMSPDGSVAIFGVSAGATLALLSAADDTLAPNVRVVAAVAPTADLRRVVRFALTGAYELAGHRVHVRPAGLLVRVAARSLAAALPRGHDRDVLLAQLPANGDSVCFPLPPLDTHVVERLSADGRRVAALLANRDPARFDSLAVDLPEPVRTALDELSPERLASRVRARVELASAPDDSYVPVGECHALVGALPDARLTVSSTLEHVRLRPSFAALSDLARFEAFAARALAGACRR